MNGKEKWLVKIGEKHYVTEGTESEIEALLNGVVRQRVRNAREKEPECYQSGAPEKACVSVNYGRLGMHTICLTEYEGKNDNQERYCKAKAIKLCDIPTKTFADIMADLE